MPKIMPWCVAVLMLSGCATGRDTLDVRVAVPVNPDTSNAVVIRSITDSRSFEVDPRQADIPSLSDEDIDNPAITSRAVARKRNSFGAAMGDILLPEGRTVSALVGEALTKTLRENGFAVYSGDESAPAGALDLDVEIERFWAWFRPGFARIAMEFAGAVKISPNPVNRSGDMRINGQSRVQGQAATNSNWQETIDLGLESLMEDMAEQLRLE